MIPRTFPSVFGTAGETKMVVYVLPSITGLQAWKDYIPVKGVTSESNVLQNTYNNGGYQVMNALDSITGKQAWKDYIPVYEDAAYNKPWSTDVGGYIPGAGLFSVLGSLFANNEQGAWYDPSDLTTLFQDSAGTTPVTAVEQPVGLVLDKRKGLVLGPELVTNGDFSNGTAGWTVSAGWSVTGGAAVAAATSLSLLQSGAPLIAGRFYRVEFDWAHAGGTLHVRVGAGTAATFTSSGRKVLVLLTASAAGVEFYGGGVSGTIDNISVRELPGNHAFQSTSASRPVLSARVNLLTKTEQFNDAAWTKSNATVTANVTTAPDGTSTADLLLDNTTNGIHQCFQNISAAGAGAYAASVYAKTGTSQFVFLQIAVDSTGRRYGVVADLSNGTITATTSEGTPSGTSSSIQSIGSGWYRITVSATTTSGAVLTVATSNSATPSSYSFGIPSYAGTGTGPYIWRADLRVANTGVNLPAYQRVNTATDYDTVGFPKYLKFDGVDDFLVTNSIDFSATDKMTVVGGYREFSNAAQVIAELSASTQANTGAFVFGAGSWVLGGNRLGGQVAGTSLLGYDSQANFAPPLTIVQSNAYNIGGTTTLQEAGLRVNGEVQSPLTSGGSGSAGSGNFGNYPLYIGRRGGTTMPFNGHLYGLIVRGAASSAFQISGSEKYMNGVTKAY